MKLFVLYSTPNGEPKQAIITIEGDDFDISFEDRTPIVDMLPDCNDQAPIYFIDCEDDDVQRLMVVEHGADAEVAATFHTYEHAAEG